MGVCVFIVIVIIVVVFFVWKWNSDGLDNFKYNIYFELISGIDMVYIFIIENDFYYMIFIE